MFSGLKYQTLTTNLRLAINRLKLLEKKKTEMALKSRKEIAAYLTDGKEDRARIRVEHIIREDYLVEAMEIIEMYCDLLLARMGLIQASKELDEGLEKPIATIIWATPRLQGDVAELKVIADQLTYKYGKEFTASCHSNSLDNVDDKLMHKLGVQAPPKILVEKYLEEIAKSYNVPFVPDVGALELDETAQAENMLIDYDGGSQNPGAFGGLSPMQPQPFVSPPAQPQMPYPQAPSLPYKPPLGGESYNPTVGTQQPLGPVDPPPVYYPAGPPAGPPAAPAQPPNIGFMDLPSVPASTFPTVPGNASTNSGEDVDFDDLTRRFEALKKKK